MAKIDKQMGGGDMKGIVILLVCWVPQLLLASTVSRENDGKFFKIKSYKVEQISESEALQRPGFIDLFSEQEYANDCSSQKNDEIDTKDVSYDEVVRIGKELWKIIEDNKAVVEVESKSVSVLPVGIECWDQLAMWKKPISKYFEVSYENYYGMKVINVVYRVSYTFAGSYKGRGKYLANVKIAPSNIDVFWGFKFSSTVSVPMAINMGTAQDPVAGVELNIHWIVKTLNQSQQSLSLFIDGLGNISQL